MNNIDNKFRNLIIYIKDSTYEELLGKIKLNYLSLPENFKHILEKYFEKFSFWGSLDYSKGDFKEIELKAKTLKSHYKDFMWFYNKLGDYTSKYILYAVLNNWIYYDTISLDKVIDKKYKHYFDLDLIPNCNREVIVDLGAYTGDSIMDYLATYGEDSYKSIYCYEITDSILDILKENLKDYDNIQLKHKAVRDRKGLVYINENGDISSNRTSNLGKKALDCTSLDEDIEERITMIKMDIEGDELHALKGSKNHIKKDCPKLLVSIYHNNDHFWQIPKFIYSINKSYKFYLRYYGGNLYPTEVVLFALPKNF